MRRKLLRFLVRLRTEVEERNRDVWINFSGTQQMIVDGTLLFYATVAQIMADKSKRKMIRCNYPNNPVVEQVLQHIGLFRLISMPGKAKITHPTVIHWNTASGNNVDGAKVAFTEGYQFNYDGSIAGETTTNPLYDGAIEAMTNSFHHAYVYEDERPNDPLRHKWWMFSEEIGGEVTAGFCDLGIGIPASIQNVAKEDPSLVQRILEALSLGRNDSGLIRAAFEVGKTRTRKTNRGKGLRDILKVLKELGSGRLTIFSYNGMYLYDESEPIPEQLVEYADSVLGTLITWNLKLKSEE